MDCNMLIEQFKNMKRIEKMAVLLRLCHELTLVSRDVLSGRLDGDSLLKLNGVSEITHQITQYALASMQGSIRIYPDDVLLRILHEQFEKYCLENSISGIWDRALKERGKVQLSHLEQ